MAQSNNSVAGVDNTFRKKFDREEYLQRAREREEKEAETKFKKSKGPPVQRKPLKHRDYQVDLESRLGKTQVVTPVAPLSQQAGYYCSVCECVVKDSANYLDHINGKKHQRALGMSMRVERASLEQFDKGCKFAALTEDAVFGLLSVVWLMSILCLDSSLGKYRLKLQLLLFFPLRFMCTDILF
ncbi:uncharacterized protein [Coffea arabica]|uniref:Uncharacterized protein isoform X2 n=1 Tax=Coffea arabica TaxID=13443 RepID=A0ABM4WZ31_COFAR